MSEIENLERSWRQKNDEIVRKQHQIERMEREVKRLIDEQKHIEFDIKRAKKREGVQS